MAWLTRGTNRYYYRRKKVAGKVRSEYIGSGDFAALIAHIDALKRQQAEDAREDAKRLVEREKATDDQIAALAKLADEHIKALMLVAGYHLHKRQWRKQRDSTTESTN